MELDDAQATFIAEALGELPDKARAVGFIKAFAKCPSAVVREGAILALARLREQPEARDLLDEIMRDDIDKDLRHMAEEILSST